MGVKISVIVPVYNVENYLKECMNSIVAQQYDNFEVICVDDGSTDGSLSILEEYKSKYEFVKVISKMNGGQSSARNCGIENATGDYLYFLDSDDMLADENVLSDMAKYVQKDDLDVLYMDGESFYESEELHKKNQWYETAYTSDYDYGICYKGVELFSIFLEHNDIRLQPCLQCIKKDFVERHKFRYFNGIIYEDNLFFFKSILSAGKVRHIKRVVMKRRVREGSIMQSKVGFNSIKSLLCIYMECTDFLRKRDNKYAEYMSDIRKFVDSYKIKIRNVFYKKLEQIEKDKIESLSLEERNIVDNILKEWEYTFPYNMFEDNSNIAIYGAGNVGVEYYIQAVESKRYNSVIVVDKRGREASTNYMDVISPEQLLGANIDKIIIAIKNKEVAMGVFEYLKSIGIDKEIIWDIRQSVEKR